MQGGSNVAFDNTYLAEKGVLAMLEMGLEATLREYKSKQGMMHSTATTYLAQWLMRNNPTHSKEGAAMLERFLAAAEERAPLEDVSAIEANLSFEQEAAAREAAAVRMQASARRHAAQVMRGEQAKAATSLQAVQRSRNVRKQIAAENAAAAKVQAGIRGRAVRRAAVTRDDAEGEEAAADDQDNLDDMAAEADMAAPMLARARAIFDQLDADGMGTLSKAELKAGLLADPDLQSLLGDADSALAMMDLDGDGEISWMEFEMMFSSSSQEAPEEGTAIDLAAMEEEAPPP